MTSLLTRNFGQRRGRMKQCQTGPKIGTDLIAGCTKIIPRAPTGTPVRSGREQAVMTMKDEDCRSFVDHKGIRKESKDAHKELTFHETWQHGNTPFTDDTGSRSNGPCQQCEGPKDVYGSR